MKLSSDEIINVIEALVGSCVPIGETNADKTVMENLKTVIDIGDYCFDGDGGDAHFICDVQQYKQVLYYRIFGALFACCIRDYRANIFRRRQTQCRYTARYCF